MTLKEYLEITGMSGYALAKLCKISFESVNRFKKGYRPSIKTAEKMEKATNGKLTVQSLTAGRLKTLKGKARKPLIPCAICRTDFKSMKGFRACPDCRKTVKDYLNKEKNGTMDKLDSSSCA